MDLRNPVFGILCGGTPAPGLNGVISAATLEAINLQCRVIGFVEGFKYCRQGKTSIQEILPEHVTAIYNQSGCILKTSKEQVRTQQEVDNCLRVLEHLRVRYLLIIGGVETAASVSLVAEAASKAKFKLSICHVPKTVFNDLPLPDDLATFGFRTARHVGSELVQNFLNDARITGSWYILVVIGAKSGHLALGVGKAAAAHITLIPEEFAEEKKLKFLTLCDLLESSIYKRRALNREYGVAVICEGVVDIMDEKDVKNLWGDVDNGHQELGRSISDELRRRLKEKEINIRILGRNIGTELRSSAPVTEDVLMTRDLGFGAVRYLIEEGKSGDTLAIRGGSLIAIPISKLVEGGEGLVRVVDLKGMPYRVALSYMIKLKIADFSDPTLLSKMAKMSQLPPKEFIKRFEAIARHNSRLQQSGGALAKAIEAVPLVEKQVEKQGENQPAGPAVKPAMKPSDAS